MRDLFVHVTLYLT